MNVFVLLDFVGILIVLYFGNYIYSIEPGNKLNKIIFVITGIAGFTALTEILRLTSPDSQSALFWFKFSFLWPFVPVLLLKFILTFTKHKLDSIKGLNYFLFVPPVLLNVIRVFSRILYIGAYHYWYGWDVKGANNIYVDIFVGFFTLIIGISFYITIAFLIKQKDKKKKVQASFILIGLTIPLLTGYARTGLSRILNYHLPPIMSISIIIGSIFFAISIIKYKYFFPDPNETIKKLFETVSDYLILFNKKGEIILVNNAFRKISKYNDDILTGKRIELFFRKSEDVNFEKINDITGKEVELKIITKYEERVTISAVFSSIRVITGSENLYLLLGRDLEERKRFEEKLITLHEELEEKIRSRTEELAHTNEELLLEINDRKKIEKALRQSEERYRNLFENSPIGIYRTTPGGEILMSNPVIIKMLGYGSFKELTERNLESESVKEHEYTRKEFKNRIESNGEIVGFESKWFRRDGREIIVRENARCVYNNNGKVIYYEGTVEDITERIQAEEALKKSEEKFRSLIENINELYYITNDKGRIIYVSPNLVNFTGYTAEQWINRRAFLFVYKEDLKRVMNFYIENRNKGALDGSIEFRSIKKDGTIFWVEQITRFVRNENGDLLEYHSVVRDINERKLAEEKLNLLAQAVKNTGDGISITDLNNNIIFVNDAFLKIFGYEEKELIGENIGIVLTESNPVPLIEEIRISTLNGGWSGELMNKKKDGIEFPIFLSTSSVLNEKGQAYALVGVTRDISERKKAEKELEEYKNHLEEIVEVRTNKIDKINNLLKIEIEKLKIAEENIQDQLVFLQILIDTIPNPVFIRDVGKIYTGCNKAFEIFHGKTKEEIIGKNVYSAGINTKPSFIEKKDDELLSNPGQQNYEIVGLDGNGEEHELLVNKATFNKTDGTLGGIIGVILDISELKKLERKTFEALEREKELSQLKSRFISVASHEFRTPLTTILSAADLLEMYGRNWPEEKYFKYINNIQRAVGYMTELINDVLTVSRADTGKTSFNPSMVDFYELAHNIVTEASLSTPANVKLNFNYEIEDKILHIDIKLMTHILTNLLSNAIKYSPGGGNINLHVKKEDEKLLLQVEDEGIGISDEDQKLLFEPFHRGNNVGAIAGTGLGLSIVEKSVEMHKGILKVKSKINEGTMVTVQFSFESLMLNNNESLKSILPEIEN